MSSTLKLPNLLKTSFLLGLMFVLSGCAQKNLYSDLKEKEANEMIAVLMRHNIDASKSPGKENTYIVMVDNRYYGEAVEILADYGYPGDHFQGLGEIFKKSGLVSSPTEERIRYMHGLSQDIQETLNLISGVLNARVHIVIPNNDPLADQIYPASAAVFIKFRRNAGVENLAPQIKNLVVKSIEGLEYANVSLSLFPVQENDVTAPAGESPITDPTRGQSDPDLVIAIVAGSIILLIGLGIGIFVFLQKKKQAAKEAEDKKSSSNNGDDNEASETPTDT